MQASGELVAWFGVLGGKARAGRRRRRVEVTPGLAFVLGEPLCRGLVAQFVGFKELVPVTMASKDMAAMCLEGLFETFRSFEHVHCGSMLQWLALRCEHMDHVGLSHPMCWHRVWHRPAALDPALMSLTQWCHRLRSLHLEGHQGFTSDALAAVGRCSQLVKLNVSKCEGADDPSLGRILAGCPHLQWLAVSRCPGVTDASLRLLPATLEHLDASFTAVTDEAVLNFAPRVRALHHVDLSGCKHISDVAVMAVAERSPQLRELLVNRTGSISDLSILAVARHCPDLLLLDVSHNDGVTDHSIREIARGCPQLGELAVSWCLGVTDVSIRIMMILCENLAKLHVRDCFFITIPALEAFREVRPQCQTFEF